MTISPISSCGIPSQCIYTGDSSILEKIKLVLAPIFEGLNYAIETKIPPNFLFTRDPRVVLWDGSHLIPHPSDFRLASYLSLILPSSCYHFVSDNKPLFGSSLRAANIEAAIASAKSFGVPVKIGKTCLEGGNCRLFIDPNGTKKAIIGILSLYISYMSLSHTGYFTEAQAAIEEIKKNIEIPSEESLQAARSLKIAQALGNYNGDSIPPQIFMSEENEIYWKEQALLFEARLILTKEKIAEELEMDVNNIAFLLQKNFHIDLELFITENGKVFIHDESLTPSLLEERFESVHQDFSKNLSPTELEMNVATLNALGVDCYRIAGVFSETEQSNMINFMNGFSLSQNGRHYFVTNGSLDKRVSDYFKHKVLELSDTEVLFIDSEEEILSSIVQEYGGGINCLTSHST